MTSKSRWILRRGALWSAQPRGPSIRHAIPRLSARCVEIQDGAVDALLDAAAQIDPIRPEAILRRFDEGRRCFAGWVDGSIAAYGWVTYGPEWVGEFERKLQVQPGEAYIWNCATLPKYRRQGLYSALLCTIADQLCMEGIERAWIIGLLSIPTMLRAFAAAGFQPIAGLSYARVLKARALVLHAYPGVSHPQMTAVRRLLVGDHERKLGPLIASYAARARLPATHYDGP